MTEKRMPTDQEIANALEIAGLSHPGMERPFYEPLPQPVADYVVEPMKVRPGSSWQVICLYLASIIAMVAFVAWLIMGR